MHFLLLFLLLNTNGSIAGYKDVGLVDTMEHCQKIGNEILHSGKLPVSKGQSLAYNCVSPTPGKAYVPKDDPLNPNGDIVNKYDTGQMVA